MNIIDAVPKICKFFPGITSALLQVGMVIVSFYHAFINSVVINTAFEDAKGVEKFANMLLMPTQYLCEGKAIHYDGVTFEIKQRFQYQTHKRLYSPVALTFFTPGIILGATLKGLALFNPETKAKHIALKAHLNSTKVVSNQKLYQKWGINTQDWQEGELCVPQGHLRHPGDENHLAPDKEALAEIVALLTEANIPFWVDCGTCIGAYRHGGVIPWDNDLDLSILVNDFQNAKNALKKLNPHKFLAQDWSSRGLPKTYIRVYVKENRNHIDIYCNDIDPKAHTITYIVSHLDSHFMAEDWKERERQQMAPIPFDVIFPLKKGMFDGIEVPVPNQTARFLQYKYGPNIDPARIYNPKTGKYEKDLSHPYWQVPLAH
ncbi:MAG: LicD family protein [Chlamydiia bacterium]|nr:LicD family protein [Chlamydiia bacterium]